jgi:aryl-alcohol dehydrogenase-like predicted oxidoreductase
MRYRSLGNTGLQVSEISLGTAEIGLDYGFKGNAHYGKPDVKESIRLLHVAIDQGINLIDTARVYGNSEEIIGQALEGMSFKPLISSKVLLSNDAPQKAYPALREEIFGSIEASLRALRLESLDILFIHNTFLEHLRNECILACLEEAKRQGKVRFLGASCYGVEVPMAVLQQPLLRVLQAPFNLLDQKMNREGFPTAAAQEVGVVVRSAYLRGVLTEQIHSIPERLAPLKPRALQALDLLGSEVCSLAEVALRFSLSLNTVSSVLIGVKTVAELEANLADASRGVLPEESMPQLQALSFGDDPIVDPQNWQELI